MSETTKYYFAGSTGWFYNSRTHTEENLPFDFVELTEEEYKEVIATESSFTHTFTVVNGRPVVIEIQPKSLEERITEIEKIRKELYADPQTGSDRLFAEAQRMQMMGLSGWEEVRDAAIARYEEIKLEYPWPVEES